MITSRFRTLCLLYVVLLGFATSAYADDKAAGHQSSKLDELLGQERVVAHAAQSTETLLEATDERPTQVARAGAG